MKKLNIYLLGGLLALGLASCEMKDELWGEKDSTDKGLLNLGVALKKAQQTKAGGEADGFPVIIEKANGTQVDSLIYSEINGPVELTVGSYTIRAHSAENLQKQMDVPYYAGETDVVIEKGMTEQADITCTMKNTQIQFGLSELVGSDYESWTITANAGDGFTYIVSDKTDNPAPIYWYLGGKVSDIRVDVTATKEGKTYRGYAIFSKSDVSESYEDDDSQFFEGGESLTIRVKPIINEDEGNEGGDDGGNEGEGGDDKPETPEQGNLDFEISVDITFDESNDTVNVPVDGTGNDSDEKPDEGEDTGNDNVGGEDDDSSNQSITISDNGTGYLENGVTVTDGNYPTDVAVVMTVPNGIKNVYVKISTSNTTFEGMVKGMGLVDGDGMDLASDAASELSSLFTLPQAGATEYTFTMSSTLFGMLGNFSGKHDFTLTIIDAKDNPKSATLTINI